MYRVLGYIGLAAIAGLYGWNIFAPPPSAPAPQPVVYREAPSIWDTQFSDRANIERAILNARASIKENVVKASLRKLDAEAAQAPGEDRIAAAMQGELKRLGCYTGRIDNSWGRGSQKAVAKFNRAALLNLNERLPGLAALARLQATNTPVCAAQSVAQNAPPKPAVVTSHLTLSANLSPPSKALDQTEKSPPALDNNAATSYLPPWTKKSASGDIGAATDAPVRSRAKVARKAPKNTDRPRVTREANARRSAFGKTSFSFAWPGQ